MDDLGLFPTPSRLALLREVAAGRVFQDRLGDSYIVGGRKVNARIGEVSGAGWVRLDRSTDLPHWRLDTAGRTVLDTVDGGSDA